MLDLTDTTAAQRLAPANLSVYEADVLAAAYRLLFELEERAGAITYARGERAARAGCIVSERAQVAYTAIARVLIASSVSAESSGATRALELLHVHDDEREREVSS